MSTGTQSAGGLGTKCAGCGHAASFHPSQEQATTYIEANAGRFAPSCTCRENNHVGAFGAYACTCVATREEVAQTPQEARA